MQIANENPARQTRILLKPGTRQGETGAEVTVAEGPLQRQNRCTLTLDECRMVELREQTCLVDEAVQRKLVGRSVLLGLDHHGGGQGP